jgi:hypothetical protein
MKILATASLLLSLSLVIAAASPAHAQCAKWKGGFNAPGVDGDVYAPVAALAVYDDGTGPALYVGGNLESAGDSAVHNLAKWNGTAWSSDLGGGVGGTVRALTVFDDGTGPALYAAGSFLGAGGVTALNIARWNGSSWSALGSGAGDSDSLFEGVNALAVYDDGSGPALYAGGLLSTAGGVAVSNIARWNGASWTALSTGIDGVVMALASFDDGSGPALYAGGYFDHAGGSSASAIAKWDGTTWSALGSGMGGGGGGPHVYALTVFDDGTGPSLFVAGHFDTAGGTSANAIAKWDGSAWSALGDGINGGSIYPLISSLSVFDDGSGQALYACGIFATAGSISAQNIARWDGTSWTALSSGIGIYYTALHVPSAMSVFDDGAGPALYVGGDFRSAGGMMTNHLARWRSSAWSTVGPGNGVNGQVNTLTAFDDGTGDALYAGGGFSSAGSTAANNLARWNGSAWSAVSSGTDGQVNALQVFDDGTGAALYAGGFFAHAGGVDVHNIARWNGTSWSALGSGVDNFVFALTVFDDGSGPALYAGGSFTTAGGIGVSHVAKWNGTIWSELGIGPNGTVHVLAVYDDGSGPALYAGGTFFQAGGRGASNFARWDGSTWSEAGGGVSGSVESMTVFDDGNGPGLYVGGSYMNAGSPGVRLRGIGRWDGTTWTNLGSGLDSPALGLSTLTVFDDGKAAALYAGGQMSGMGGIPVNHVARWDGLHWSGLDHGLDSTVNVLFAMDVTGSGTADLYAGGFFQKANSMPTWHVAQWIACPHTGTRLCFGDGSGAPCPCGNSGAAGHGCENSGSTGGALLDAGGTASLAADTLWLTSSGERPSALSIFLQGNAEIAPAMFGDGLLCTSGSLHRMFVKNAYFGTTSSPGFGDPTLSDRSAQLGDVIVPGTTRIYQVYYRDPDPAFCPEGIGSTFNISNAVKILWAQ